MTKPIDLEINCATGERIETEWTDEQIAAAEAAAAETLARIEAAEAMQAEKEAARQSAISKLQEMGLTEEEALAMVGL
jgi:hypothetical protein